MNRRLTATAAAWLARLRAAIRPRRRGPSPPCSCRVHFGGPPVVGHVCPRCGRRDR